MTILQMEYFVSVAEQGSFSRTAEKFFISQQGISRQIMALEQDIQETQAEYDALIADMETRINAVQDGDARDLLRKRYLEFLPWSEIMKEMGYSKSHVFRLHSTAVAALKSWDTVGLANTGNV